MLDGSQVCNPVFIKAVLFDLDGTLIDTAPDLVAALNLSLAEHGYPHVTVNEMRHVASDGSLALVRAAQPNIDEAEKTEIQQGLLRHYSIINGKHSFMFDGIPALLDYLDSHGIPYGIVTNKPARFTRPLIEALKLTSRMKTVISGDSTLMSKPKAAPMLLAAQQIDCEPENILYLGDAQRDLVAAANTHMLGGIAMWGYIGPDANPQHWPSNFSFQSPQDVVRFLEDK
jgi:2-phosphoglycolate phosphatase